MIGIPYSCCTETAAILAEPPFWNDVHDAGVGGRLAAVAVGWRRRSAARAVAKEAARAVAGMEAAQAMEAAVTVVAVRSAEAMAVVATVAAD